MIGVILTIILLLVSIMGIIATSKYNNLLPQGSYLYAFIGVTVSSVLLLILLASGAIKEGFKEEEPLPEWFETPVEGERFEEDKERFEDEDKEYFEDEEGKENFSFKKMFKSAVGAVKKHASKYINQAKNVASGVLSKAQSSIEKTASDLASKGEKAASDALKTAGGEANKLMGAALGKVMGSINEITGKISNLSNMKLPTRCRNLLNKEQFEQEFEENFEQNYPGDVAEFFDEHYDEVDSSRENFSFGSLWGKAKAAFSGPIDKILKSAKTEVGGLIEKAKSSVLGMVPRVKEVQLTAELAKLIGKPAGTWVPIGLCSNDDKDSGVCPPCKCNGQRPQPRHK